MRNKAIIGAVAVAVIAVLLSIPAVLQPSLLRAVQMDRMSESVTGAAQDETSSLPSTAEPGQGQESLTSEALMPAGLEDVDGGRLLMFEGLSLPSYTPIGEASSEMASSQAFAQAQAWGLAVDFPSDPASAVQGLRADLNAHLPVGVEWHRTVEFWGNTSEELQDAVDNFPGYLIEVKAEQLQFDSTVSLPDNTHIQGNGVRIWCELEGAAFSVVDATKVSLQNLEVSGNADIAVFARDASHLVVSGCHFHALRGMGVVVSGQSSYFHILDNSIRQNKQGGIQVGGASSYGSIARNDVSYNNGMSNWMAGIVLTSLDVKRSGELWDAFPTTPPYSPQRDTIVSADDSVHNVLVQGNTIERNESMGVYCDGVYRCYMQGNTIHDNDKEGVGLSGGCTGCVATGNDIAGNGKRALQSAEALENDGVAGFGTMADGSSKAKLAGVTLDNVAYNTVEGNSIKGNWGGGVKAVRSAMRNVIARNNVADNNKGKNDAFTFSGIELACEALESQASGKDQLPDFENLIMGNTVSGGHYAGIMLVEGCAGNVVSGNVVQGSTHYALLNDSRLSNSLSGNTYTGRVLDRSILGM